MKTEDAKNFWEGHKEVVHMITVIGALATTGFALGYCLGLKNGENRLVERLIHKYETGDGTWPVRTSADKNLGDLMYVLSAECIGD